MKHPEFAHIEPYDDADVPAAIKRVTRNILFNIVCHKINPKINVMELKKTFRSITTVDEFQRRIMIPMLLYVAKTTMNKFTCEGFDQLDNKKSYLFVSNHRDITLDAAMLGVMLMRHNLPCCEISFGDNLIANPFVNDLARLNRMFPIFRGGTPRQALEASQLTSKYIRYAITEKGRSVWIAQRNGRTKDGDDKTEPGLIRMLNMSHQEDFVESISQLNIVPVAVSYEFEPCAFRKVNELRIKQEQGYYQKRRNEDIQSTLEGLLEQKGDVHFCICKPITREEIEACSQCTIEPNTGKRSKNAPNAALAELIDHRIYDGYKLHQTNINAYNQMKELGDDELDSLENMLLRLYAKPVENELNQQ